MDADRSNAVIPPPASARHTSHARGLIAGLLGCVGVLLAGAGASLAATVDVGMENGVPSTGAVQLAQSTPARSAPLPTDPPAPQRGRLDWPSAWSPVTDPPAKAGQAEPTAAATPGAPASAQPGTSGDPPSGIQTTQAPIDVPPTISPPGLAPKPQPSTEAGGNAGPAPPASSTTAPAASPSNASTPALSGTGQPPAAGLKGTTPTGAAPAEAPPAATETAAPKTVDTTEIALPADLKRAIDPVAAVETRMDGLFKTVERLKDRESELARLQPQIEQLINGALEQISILTPGLTDLETQRGKLGPVPNGDKAVPESLDIQKERSRLNALIAAVDGAIKKAELQQVRGRQLIGRIQSLRQSIFTRNTFERTPSPFSLDVIGQAFTSIPDGFQQVDVITRQWVATASKQALAVGGFFVLAVLAYILLRMAAHRIVLSKLAHEGGEVSFFEKTLGAGLFAPLVVLPSIIAAVILYLGLDRLGLIYLQFGSFARFGLIAIIVWAVTSALARAYLQPQRPRWRLAEVDDRTAWRLYRLLQAIAAVYAIDMVLREVYPLLFVPISARIFSAFVVAVIFAVLFYFLARTPLPKAQTLTSGLLTGLRPEFIKLPLLFLSAFIIISGSIGYVALARFVAGQVVVTSAAVLLIVIAFLAVRAIGKYPEFMEAMGHAPGRGDEDPEGVLSLTRDQQKYVVWLVSLILYCGLSLLAPILLLFSFGFSWIDISGVINRALFGFEVGGMRISLLQVAIALALFAAILLVTRTVQSGLSNSVFQPGKTDPGLANSIKTGIGYVGFGLAALAGLSYAGLDITNLAIVAGALSVGIGFGLQSIVNNFVSGLILLVERPIKVGDWIKVADQQGYVRRISVRSTEIETFERASVIVPNSELIAGTVTNLTHRNAMGRQQINVGVSYDADPVRVREILLKTAEDCELVARHPAPFVVFEDFGDSALMFSLRAYLSDISRGLSAQTELRTGIFKALKDNGIGIPFPQRDLHLRDLDGVKDMLARAAEDRMRKAMGGQDQQPDGRPGKRDNVSDVHPAAATAAGTKT
ncbi:MAG: DUF3772 domain-containing protein [Pseudomonadota bacterium]